ncbi:MAG: glycosyltransferase [Moritella sp.]|uniref:glycosyltransferase family 2 protein n=1 Tax=Moritella sp. TaxID=78556 RepID=UPI0025F82A6D|nr:glycosyltransferase [Moritella sp.]NQZ93766.1 glycosyltransferase [Moritella sp.]
MSSILFSVVIPLYNQEKLISRTIESVFEQKIDNLELIIVDDGSTDNSVDVVNKYKDKRIKLITQPNSGAPTARNRGIAEATGEYIALLDADDYFLEGHLERAKNIIEKECRDGSYSKIIVDRGGDISFLKPSRGIGENENMSEYLLANRGFIQTSVLVLKSNIAKKVNYLPDLKGGQDTDYAIRLYAEGYKLAFIEEPGAVWLDHVDENRISSKIDFNNRIHWLKTNKSMITKKAYLADYGWFIAKSMARDGMKIKALSLYLRALINLCYPPKLAIVVLFQVTLSPYSFRRFSDVLAKFGIKP